MINYKITFPLSAGILRTIECIYYFQVQRGDRRHTTFHQNE